MNNLSQRAIFGLLYVALMLCAIVLDSKPIFLSIFSVLAFCSICEYSTLVGLHRTRPMRVILDALAVVYTMFAVYMSTMLALPIYLIPYMLYLAYIIIRSMYSNRKEQPTELAKILLGQMYIAIPFGLAALMHSSGTLLPMNREEYRILLLMMMLCIWANDTGAFLVGCTMGKRRLFVSLSPKKSWEGFIGGAFFSALVAWAIVHYVAPHAMCHYKAIGIGLLISSCATWGDLFESMLKRNADVKDSGKLIPGHGGVLDRIDSMLFVLPMVFIVYVMMSYFNSMSCSI